MLDPDPGSDCLKDVIGSKVGQDPPLVKIFIQICPFVLLLTNIQTTWW